MFPVTVPLTRGHSLRVSRSVLVVAALVIVNVAIFLVLENVTGRIVEGEGRGWDGAAYVDMLREGVLEHSSNERLRPLVVLFNRPLYWLSDRSVPGAVDVFASMNVVYMAWLTVAVALLASEYGASHAARAFLAVNIALCVSTSKLFAYYPTLVDLGAYAVITTAVYAVVRRKPLAGPVLATMAALSREFGGAVALFGIHREIRLGRSPVRALAMYSPAIAAALLWRYAVSRLPGFGLLSAGDFAQNLSLWRDVGFVAFFLYYAVTVFGGLSMVLMARPAQCTRLLRREPEWITFSVGIVAMAAVGNADIWRYLAYTLPVAVALLAACDAEWTNWHRLWMFSLGTLGTLVTQRPFELIQSPTYLSHWFPYYVIPSAPPDDLERLWLYWGWMMLVTGVLVWLMAAPDTARRSGERATGTA